MLALLLLACAAPEPYAGCTVGLAWTEVGGEPSVEASYRYDAEGRAVEEAIRYVAGGSRVTTRTWQGDCPVEARLVLDYETAYGEAVTTTWCDAHDSPALVEVVEDWVLPDGGTATASARTVYANDHDVLGRLVEQTLLDAEGAPEWTVTQVWGGCDDPVRTYGEAEEFAWEIAVTCRDDGQPLERFTAMYSGGGAGMASRVTRAYDADGRWVRETEDSGPGSTLIRTQDATWADPAAPGPTEVVYSSYGQVTAIVTYTYDCPS